MRVMVLRQCFEKSQARSLYRFRSRGETIAWPKRNGEFLGAVGAWNCLFRLGLMPEWLQEAGDVQPDAGDLLFVVAESDGLGAEAQSAVDRWLAGGGTLVASGVLPAWKAYLPEGCVVEQRCCEYPYAALGWRFGDDQPELVAPPGWPYGKLLVGRDVTTRGGLVAIRGERQTPCRALVTQLKDAPALIRHGNFLYLNGNPFGAFQAWLQGQEGLNPWLQWRHRLFWLDEQLSFILRIMNGPAQLSRRLVPRPIPGLPETVVVLRHDLDHSRDTSYIEAEREVGLTGVHAVLRDGNARFWLDTLRRAPEHEAAFHYTTATYNRWIEGVRSKLGLPKHSYRPARHEVVGDGLLKQVRWAKRNGVGISTLHRHLSYLIYPEWIDAMHRVFQELPEVYGSSSLFRGNVLRWGASHLDEMVASDFPDAQFPYWFPCKLAHAGLGGLPLKGWESASVMEIEPELFTQMLEYRTVGIMHRVITVNYHPAHAIKSTFYEGGSLESFKGILNIIKEKEIKVMTLKELCAVLNKEI